MQINGHVALLRNESSGQELTKHVPLLKALPKVLPTECVEPILTSTQTKRKLAELDRYSCGARWRVPLPLHGHGETVADRCSALLLGGQLSRCLGAQAVGRWVQQVVG